MNRNEIFRQYLGHFGSIFFNIGIAGVVLALACIASGVLWIVALLFFLCFTFISVVFTLGTVLTFENYRKFLSNTKDLLFNQGLVDVMEKMMQAFPYIAAVTAAALIASFILLLPDRQNTKSKTRLIVLGVMFALLIALVIVVLISGRV